MVFNNFDKKANELLVEFLPVAAPIVVAGPQLGAMATGLIGSLIAVLGTAAAIHSSVNKADNLQPTTSNEPVDLGGGVTIGKQPEAKRTEPIDLGGGVTIGAPTETQPVPAEQQPMTLPNVERGKPGYAVPSRIPAFRPVQPDVRPGIPDTSTQQKTQVQTQPVLPAPIPTTGQAQATQPGTPQPPQSPPQPGQQTGRSMIAAPIPPLPSFNSETKRRASIEAYPIDRQLGDINVPGTKTAYRDTFNMPAMQAFDTGLNQPKLQQNVPQGDIPNAPASLRAKYKHRAENPDEYEGTKAFGGISNLFK